MHLITDIFKGPSWPYSHVSWIYNYLRNQYSITTDAMSVNLDQGEVYNIMW